MYRKISGFFTPEKSVAPVTFLSGVRIEYNERTILLTGESLPKGTPWPGTARQRRIIQALDEQNGELMYHVVPPAAAEKTKPGSFNLKYVLLKSSAPCSGNLNLNQGT